MTPPRGRDLTAGLAVAPLLLSIVSLCVGTSFAKTLFPIAGAAGTTALRVGLAALILVLVQRPWRWRVERDHWRVLTVYGVVLACMNLSFYAAVARLPLGVAVAIEFLGPLGVALIGSRRPLDLVWVVMAAAGVAALVLPGSAGDISPTGVGYALLAALFWAGYILAGARAAQRVPQGRIVCLGLCIAAVIAVPVGIGSAGTALLDPSILISGLLVAVLCSILPYSLEIVALKRLAPAVFGIVVSLEPAIGALAGFAVIGERLAPMQLAGIASIIVAAAGGTVIAARRKPPTPPVL